MKRALLFFSGLICVLGFVLFTLYARHANLHQFDFDITVRVQNHTPHRLDGLLSYLSLIGRAEVVTVLVLVLVWLERKHRGIMILVCYLAGLGIEVVGKGMFSHPAPPFMFYRYNFGPMFPSNYVHDVHSYPSGHSLRTSFVILALCLAVLDSPKLPFLWKVVLFSLLLSFASLMFYSRVSLGEHWPSDVIAGAVLGGGLALITGAFTVRADGKHSASSSG